MVKPLELIKMLLARGADPNAKLTKLIPARAVLDFPDVMMGEGAFACVRRRWPVARPDDYHT